MNLMEDEIRAPQMIHLLKRWYYFEHNINLFDENELRDVKAFFYRLSYLTENERDFLAYIYYHESYKDIPKGKIILEKYSFTGLKKPKNLQDLSVFKSKILIKLLDPVTEPYDPEKQDESVEKSYEELKWWKRIEELFNELQKLHPGHKG